MAAVGESIEVNGINGVVCRRQGTLSPGISLRIHG